MIKEFTYEKQGDGSDSWLCIEKNEQGKEITRYMVYEDPYAVPDIPSMLTQMTPEQMARIAQLLKPYMP